MRSYVPMSSTRRSRVNARFMPKPSSRTHTSPSSRRMMSSTCRNSGVASSASTTRQRLTTRVTGLSLRFGAL
jgi:hypothetical protein